MSHSSDPQAFFPIFLRLADRPVLLVGGGSVAAAKLSGLLGAGAQVTVVAPALRPELARPGVQLVRRAFAPEDLEGKWFAVAAAPADVNRQVAKAALRRRIFVNAADDPASASAYLGGVVRRGGVTVAISTGGRAPALSALLRQGLEALLPEDLSDWLDAAERLRARWRLEGVPMKERRPLLLHALDELYARRGTPAPQELAAFSPAALPPVPPTGA